MKTYIAISERSSKSGNAITVMSWAAFESKSQKLPIKIYIARADSKYSQIIAEAHQSNIILVNSGRRVQTRKLQEALDAKAA